MCGPFKSKCLGFQQYLPPTHLSLRCFLQPEVIGTFLPGTETLDWGWYSLLPKYPSRVFIHSIAVGSACPMFPPLLPRLRASYQSGWMWFLFNSINSISDGSEWWLFYSLVIILMWLCEEVSCVYLCHHLDWKSGLTFYMRRFEDSSLLHALIFQVLHLAHALIQREI